MHPLSRTLSLIAVMVMAIVVSTNAATVVATDPATAVGGTTTTVEGSSFVTAGTGKYQSSTIVGSDRVVEILASPTSNDYYINAGGLSIDTVTHRYAQVYYSLDSAFSGSTHQLRLDTSDQGAAFVNFNASATIPASAGSHSFVIDLQDDTDLGGGGYSGDLNVFRWDWWNNGGNGGKTFTIDKVVFGSVQAVPVVPNGSFETPQQPDTNTTTRYELGNGGGGGTLVGSIWDFGSDPSGITRNGSAFTPPSAPDGVQAAILRGNTQFSTTVEGFEAGVTYSISFEAAARGGGLGPTTFQVLIDGNAIEFGGLTSLTPAGTSYASFVSDGFTTDGGSLELIFDGLTGGDLTTFIDDVQIAFVAAAPVPVPAALPVGLALIGLVVTRRRRR